MPTTTNQVFNFFVEVLGDDVYVLQRIPVRIIVPANVPTYPAEGRYTRDYDSFDYCESNERPDWNSLTWNVVSVPTGTSVGWELRTADSLSDLASATPVTFDVPGTASPVDLGELLVAAGQFNNLRFLRIDVRLRSNAERTRTPVLNSFNATFACLPQE